MIDNPDSTVKAFSPWDTNPESVSKVKNPLPIPESCCHCGNKVELVNSSEIYGHEVGRWPWVYSCSPIIPDSLSYDNACGAHVGIHPGTNIPLGTLAKKETRDARKKAKELFIALFESGKITKKTAYEKLAAKLGIENESCHFAWFDVEQCKKAEIAIQSIQIDIASHIE